jgi:hypothetical protein
MKKTTILVVSAIGICFVVVLSCTGMLYLYVQVAADRVPTLVVVNNSGQRLTVTSAATVVPLPSSMIAEVPFPSTPPPVILVGTADGRTWKYKWAPLDGASYGYGFQIYLQIEADGAIYVLPGKVKGVSKPLPAQPASYPLKPQ